MVKDQRSIETGQKYQGCITRSQNKLKTQDNSRDSHSHVSEDGKIARSPSMVQTRSRHYRARQRAESNDPISKQLRGRSKK
jgi:hypothetical protein